jgi:hypothetical protein
MKTLVLTALLGLAVATTGAVSAHADTFTVHGYQGTVYGR